MSQYLMLADRESLDWKVGTRHPPTCPPTRGQSDLNGFGRRVGVMMAPHQLTSLLYFNNDMREQEVSESVSHFLKGCGSSTDAIS